jgi:hypothetical protein
MLWNGNECGIRLGNENIKATNSNTHYDSIKTAGGMWNILNTWAA